MQDNSGKNGKDQKSWIDRVWNRNGDKEGQNGEPGQSRPRVPSWLIGVLILALIGWYLYQNFVPRADSSVTSVPYSVVTAQIDAGNVKEATITDTSIKVDLEKTVHWDKTDQTIGTTGGSGTVETDQLKATIPPVVQTNNQQLMDQLAAQDVVVNGEQQSSSLWTGLLVSFLPILLFLGLIVFMGRQMTRGQQNVFGFGRSQARQHDPERPQVTFADVAGEEEAKRELTEVVDFLRNPAKYHQLGARLPRGVLLVGPPGTGKTLMARAVAGEAGVPFFSISASEFVEMFVGVGASRVRDLFEKAKTNSPAIIFIDELDAVGRQRFAGLGGSNDEREQTLNQLLVEMDGFDTNQEVIVMAATNRPDVLDPALLRPGRFDRQVTIGLPDRRGPRGDPQDPHAAAFRSRPMSTSASIARGTTGFSGADLSNLVNEAALTAARRNKKADRQQRLRRRARQGSARHRPRRHHESKKSARSSPTTRGSCAGRAPDAGYRSARKVTSCRVVARWASPSSRRKKTATTSPRPICSGRLDTALGGRAAEIVIFDEITTGAESDLKQATALARRMVGLWGMSDEVGPVYLGTGEEHVFLGREIVQEKAFSDATATRLDMAVRDIVEQALGRASDMVSSNLDKLELLVKALLEKETLDAAEVTAILGPRPGGAPAEPISLDTAIEEQRTPVDLNGSPVGATE